MTKDKPFIHLLRTPYGYYIFDVNTDMIIQINESVYKYLEIEQSAPDYCSVELSKQTIGEVKKLKDEGFLSSQRPKEILHPYDEVIEFRLNNKLNGIILQLTQSCNMRCNYCIYSDLENNILQRKHSNKKLSYDLATKAIDFLIEHSIDSETINIGFYGGEPLLEFDLIKKCIQYAKIVSEGKRVTFSLTTNGTLLNYEIAKYLYEHNVSALISLDGPREIHDLNRRLRDGRGTFDIIMKNLSDINERCPEFLKGIRFNMVLNSEKNFSCTDKFIFSTDIIRNDNLMVTSTSYQFSSNKGIISEDFISQLHYESFKVFLNQFGKIGKKHLSSIASIAFNRFINDIGHFERTSTLPSKMSHSGPCTPGETRLFMNTDGVFFPCERVSETSNTMKIGDINTGFDISNVKKIMNIGKLTELNCKDCWALKHCTLCASFADDSCELSAAKKASNCGGVKNSFENLIRDYMAFKEIKWLYKENL